MSRTPLIIFATAAVFIAAAFAAIQVKNEADAGAAGPMSAIALDLDPTGNTSSAVGTFETCKRINENDMQDADETGVDTVPMDLVAVGIPAGAKMIAFQAFLVYNENAMTVQTNQTFVNQNGGGDPTFIIAVDPDSSIFPGSDPAPDTDGNGYFVAAALDVGVDAAESGTGVLARMTVSSDAGASAGQYTFTYDANNPPLHIDETATNRVVAVANRGTATIAINQPCPGGPTDTPPPGTPTPTPTPTPSPTAEPTLCPECTATPVPTPTPEPTPCKTECPTETPEPTPTETPEPTPTPTECPECTPTPVPTASPTPTPGPSLLKGDLQCDGDVDSVDALMALRHIASLGVTQTQPCPPIGSSIARQIGGAGSNIFGDINCNGTVEAVDPLFILRHIAALSVSLPQGCAPIGQ